MNQQQNQSPQQAQAAAPFVNPGAVSSVIPGINVVTGNEALIPQFLVIAREKEGKCLAGSTLITLASGQRVKLKDFVSATRVLSMGHGGLIEEALAPEFMRQGVKQLYALTTQSGRRIEATASHRFMTQRGWVALQDLDLDEDRVFVVAEYPKEMFWRGVQCSAAVAKLLGYCIADGYLEPDLKFTKNEDAVRDDFIAALTELGDTFRVEERTPDHSTAVVVRGGTRSSKLVALLEETKLLGLRSAEKFVPEEVFMWSRAACATFLNALFTCDGSVEARGAVSYSSTSMQLIADVQHLCSRFGILGRIKRRFVDGKLHGAEFIIQGRANIIKFADSIGMFGEKQTKLLQLRAEMAARPVVGVETQMWQHGPYLLDRIASVEPTTEEEVFDISVMKHHNFIANDFVVHNSATVGTTLVNWPREGLHPLFLAFDESGPNSCLTLGYQPHVMPVKKLPGATAWEKTREALTQLEANRVKLHQTYGSLIVDCGSTMLDMLHESARRFSKNPDPRSHFGEALMQAKEVMNRLMALELPIWWLAWLREPETVEERGPNPNVKIKRILPGGPNIIGNFRSMLAGKVQHIFILEKVNVGRGQQGADSDGFARIFHTKDWQNIRAGGRFSHLLPEPMPAHAGYVMSLIRR